MRKEDTTPDAKVEPQAACRQRFTAGRGLLRNQIAYRTPATFSQRLETFNKLFDLVHNLLNLNYEESPVRTQVTSTSVGGWKGHPNIPHRDDEHNFEDSLIYYGFASRAK